MYLYDSRAALRRARCSGPRLRHLRSGRDHVSSFLSGRLPFDAPGQVVRGNSAPPSSHRADVDPRLEAICLKAMAASSAAHYASMGELASAVTDYLRSRPATAGPGNLVPNTVDKAAIFQAPTAPGPLPGDEAAIFQAPTLVPGPLADGTSAQRVRKATRVAIDRSSPPARPRVWFNRLVVTGIACAPDHRRNWVLGRRGYSHHKGSNRPVEQVTWDDADTVGRGLTKKLSDGHVYRLATEAEWEYSCRGGRPSTEPFGIGDGRSITSRDANLNGTLGETVNAGSYEANALGLYDMHGNVWEWCADRNEPYSEEAVTNHLRVAGGPFRMARGGCYNEPAAECRSALRQGSPVERRDCWLGFRLARSVPSAGMARVQSTN